MPAQCWGRDNLRPRLPAGKWAQDQPFGSQGQALRPPTGRSCPRISWHRRRPHLATLPPNETRGLTESAPSTRGSGCCS